MEYSPAGFYLFPVNPVSCRDPSPGPDRSETRTGNENERVLPGVIAAFRGIPAISGLAKLASDEGSSGPLTPDRLTRAAEWRMDSPVVKLPLPRFDASVISGGGRRRRMMDESKWTKERRKRENRTQLRVTIFTTPVDRRLDMEIIASPGKKNLGES